MLRPRPRPVGPSATVQDDREADARLRASEARFRDCAEASSDYLWESDTEHRFTSWQGGEQIASFYPDAEVIGRKRWEVSKADPSLSPWREHLADLAARRPFKNFVFSTVQPDGRTRWVKSSGKPFFSEGGHFAGYRGASSDITESMDAQRQLQIRAQQQQALALLGQAALQTNDPERLFETAAEILARTLDVAFVAIMEKDAAANELVMSVGRGWQPEEMRRHRVPASNGSLSWRAIASAEPVCLADIHQQSTYRQSALWARYGIVAGMAAGIGDPSQRVGSVVVGCTQPRVFDPGEANFLQAIAFVLGAAIERRNTDASLRHRDRALEAIGQGLVICDALKPDLPVVYANPSFARARGVPAAELLGCALTALFRSEDNPDLADDIGQALRQKGVFSARLLTRQSAAVQAWDDVTISNVVNDDGVVTHHVAVQTDVTQRVVMEAELRQAQKMDAVGKLTGGVAHDFNNLLTVILGNAEVIVDNLADPRLTSSAEMILGAAERGSDLVQRLLTLGRRQSLQPGIRSLDGIVANLAALLRRTIGADILFCTELGCDGETTFIDQSQLETAILNLVTNARDAMTGGGTLTVATHPVEIEAGQSGAELKPGSYLALTVRDTGCGMPADVKERAFEPFFTTKEVGKGTGLGLSTVYGFAQQSGGHVRIDTALGRGTSVEILLPKIAGAIAPERARTYQAAETGGERVLLIEDQDNVRTFVRRQLEWLGYDVTCAGTGLEALAVLRRDDGIELLFSDILLPGEIDGITLAEMALEFRPALKILFTSGYSDYAVERRSRLIDAGVPLLKKPYRRHELSTALRTALKGQP